MILTRESYTSKYRRLAGWHRWFAWHPVRVANDRYAWMTFVERMATPLSLEDHGGFVWAYRVAT